jgi:hypothetical protein
VLNDTCTIIVLSQKLPDSHGTVGRSGNISYSVASRAIRYDALDDLVMEIPVTIAHVSDRKQMQLSDSGRRCRHSSACHANRQVCRRIDKCDCGKTDDLRRLGASHLLHLRHMRASYFNCGRVAPMPTPTGTSFPAREWSRGIHSAAHMRGRLL